MRHSQDRELNMASQRSSAETKHAAIVAKPREEFNELVKQERAQTRVIREEAADISNCLAGQLAAERMKCHELEVIAEHHLQAANHEYVVEVQRLRAAKGSLADELNITCEHVTWRRADDRARARAR